MILDTAITNSDTNLTIRMEKNDATPKAGDLLTCGSEQMQVTQVTALTHNRFLVNVIRGVSPKSFFYGGKIK